MRFTKLYSLRTATTLLFCHFGLNLFNVGCTGNSIYLDVSSRLNLNDTTINLFYFYWTTFTYLGAFFFASVLIWFWLSKLPFASLCTALYLFYILECVDFMGLNYTAQLLNFHYLSSNTLLSNNLNKYHPYIFYSGVFVFATILAKLTCYLYRESSAFRVNSLQLWARERITFMLVCSWIALFLGSWWAFQEGTWGGWWNWDPSEVFGLLVALSATLLLHTRAKVYDFTNFYRTVHFYFLLTIFFYFFTQLNFDLVSHNFGAKFNFMFALNPFYLEVLGYLILSLTLLSILSYTSSISGCVLHSSPVPYLSSVNWLRVYLYSLVILVLGVSFSPLFVFFLWQYFNVEVATNLLCYPEILILIFSLLAFTFHRPFLLRLTGVYPILLMSFYTSLPIFLFSARSRVNPLYILHWFLLFIIYYNFFTTNAPFILWSFSTYGSKTSSCASFRLPTPLTYVCSNFWLETSCTSSSTSSVTTSDVILSYRTFIPTTNAFHFSFDKANWLNSYPLSRSYLDSSLRLEDNFTNNLYELLLLFALLLGYSLVG